MINVQQLRGDSSTASAYIGPMGEIVVDTSLWALRIQDDITPGGHLLSPNNILSGYAIGNTTGSTSSTTAAITNFSVSGAGGVSVGWNTTAAGHPALVISGATGVGAASFANIAIGNTTAATSSTTLAVSSWSLSGAGGLSVGYSTTGPGAGVIVLSGAAAGIGSVGNLFALGNTTGATSSATNTLSQLSVSGAGNVSVGLSTTAGGAEVLVISGSAGAAGGVIDFFEPMGLNSGLTIAQALTNTNVVLFAPLVAPAGVTFNQVRAILNRQPANADLTLTSSAGTSGTAAVTCTQGETKTLILYSRAGGTSTGTFTSFATSSISEQVSDVWSVSQSLASMTLSFTRNLVQYRGNSATTIALTGTSSAAAPFVGHFIFMLGATSSNYFANATGIRWDFPWATSFAAGNFAIGFNWGSTASGSTSAGTATWILNSGPNPAGFNRTISMQIGIQTNQSIVVPTGAWTQPAIGSSSSTGATASFPWEGLSNPNQYGQRPYYQLGVLGTN